MRKLVARTGLQVKGTPGDSSGANGRPTGIPEQRVDLEATTSMRDRCLFDVNTSTARLRQRDAPFDRPGAVLDAEVPRPTRARSVLLDLCFARSDAKSKTTAFAYFPGRGAGDAPWPALGFGRYVARQRSGHADAAAPFTKRPRRTRHFGAYDP